MAQAQGTTKQTDHRSKSTTKTKPTTITTIEMRTLIFKNFEEFDLRNDRSVNGVSELFALQNTNYEAANKSNRGCWNCLSSEQLIDCIDCDYCKKCYGCKKCDDCIGCKKCDDCIWCSYDTDCNNKAGDEVFIVPAITNIHQKIEASLSNYSDYDIYFRSKQVILLAGQSGKEIQSKKSVLFAAMLIYLKSSPIRVRLRRLFENWSDTIADIKRCAEEEKNLII